MNNWLVKYSKQLQAGSDILMLADVYPAVQETLRASGALDVIGQVSVFPATTRVLDAEHQAWEAAQELLAGRQENSNQPANAG